MYPRKLYPPLTTLGSYEGTLENIFPEQQDGFLTDWNDQITYFEIDTRRNNMAGQRV